MKAKRRLVKILHKAVVTSKDETRKLTLKHIDDPLCGICLHLYVENNQNKVVEDIYLTKESMECALELMLNFYDYMRIENNEDYLIQKDIAQSHLNLIEITKIIEDTK